MTEKHETRFELGWGLGGRRRRRDRCCGVRRGHYRVLGGDHSYRGLCGDRGYGARRWSTRRAHPPASEAPHVKPLDDGRYRVLVVADESVTSQLAEDLQTRAGGRPVSVFVIAPALESRLGLLTEDQRGYDEASQRLKEILEGLEGAGLPAQGEIGSNDPLQAADDGLRQFPANEIVFATHPEGKTNWLEDGVVALAESRSTSPSGTSPSLNRANISA